MEITEVRVKLVERPSERLRAFCSITLDGDFVVRDLKIIGGANGAFVAMPSRKLADRCPRCGSKNHLRAKYCNECSAKLNENRAPKDSQGRAKLHADVAHPINAPCRERIQNAVIEAYKAETERAKSPDYQPPSFEDFEDDLVEEAEPAEPAPAAAPKGDEPGRGDDSFGDYNSLIEDLKREAATREHKRRQGQMPRTIRPEEQPADRAGAPSRPEPPQPQQPERVDRDDSRAPSPPDESAAAEAPAPESTSLEPDRSPEAAGESSSAPPSSAPASEPARPEHDESDGFGAGLF